MDVDDPRADEPFTVTSWNRKFFRTLGHDIRMRLRYPESFRMARPEAYWAALKASGVLREPNYPYVVKHGLPAGTWYPSTPANVVKVRTASGVQVKRILKMSKERPKGRDMLVKRFENA